MNHRTDGDAGGTPGGVLPPEGNAVSLSSRLTFR